MVLNIYYNYLFFKGFCAFVDRTVMRDKLGCKREGMTYVM